MKYFFPVLLLGSYFVAVLASTNLTTKPVKTKNGSTKDSQCNINNYNFYAGPNSKKIENMFSEVKQQLAELKQEMTEVKENLTGGLGGKADNSTMEASQCNASNYDSFLAIQNHTKEIKNMFSEVKQQLAELKGEIKEIKENVTGRLCGKVYKNCADAYKSGGKISGVYKIDPDGLGEFKVFCDQKTAGGGWTVFQKRFNGSVYFGRTWDDYKRGFGNLNGEFWLGLDKIHRLTVSSSNKLRVDLEDIHGQTAFAEYSSFSVAYEAAKYELSLGSYSGTAGDSLGSHRGSAFSTKDRDNDICPGLCHCASLWKGGWWYYHCHRANLNGLYMPGNTSHKGMSWYHWKNSTESVKRSEMKIRPKDF
ncbi:hypothetical protein ACROYT_G004172 [Oculina patagonica]